MVHPQVPRTMEVPEFVFLAHGVKGGNDAMWGCLTEGIRQMPGKHKTGVFFRPPQHYVSDVYSQLEDDAERVKHLFPRFFDPEQSKLFSDSCLLFVKARTSEITSVKWQDNELKGTGFSRSMKDWLNIIDNKPSTAPIVRGVLFNSRFEYEVVFHAGDARFVFPASKIMFYRPTGEDQELFENKGYDQSPIHGMEMVASKKKPVSLDVQCFL